jgi:hypothetical protein
LNKEPPPVASVTNDNKEENGDEDDWEKLLDNDDNLPNNDLVEEVKFEKIFFCLCFSVLQKIQAKFKKNLQIKKPTNDYAQWSVDDMQMKEADLAHVVEVSNFPSTFRTEDLSNAFKTLT